MRLFIEIMLDQYMPQYRDISISSLFAPTSVNNMMYQVTQVF
jgi:hypothetical protein